MTQCNFNGSPAYNISDIQPYGFINNSLVYSFPPGQSPTPSEISNPITGIAYKQVPVYDSSGNVITDKKTGLIETNWVKEIQILPASSMQVGFYFGVQAQSSQTSEGSGGYINSNFAFGGIAGSLIASIANTTFLGGTANIKNNIGWTLCSGDSYFDMPIPITAEIISTGVVKLPNNIISIQGVFTSPLNLSDLQKKYVGVYEYGVFPPQGAEQGIQDTLNSILITGGTIFNGLYIPPIFPPADGTSSQEIFQLLNLFLNVLRDPRNYVVRSDNNLISSVYSPFQINPYNFNDVNSNYIQIDTAKIKSSDKNLYITCCLSKENKFREQIYTNSNFIAGGSRLGLGTSQVINIGNVQTIIHYAESSFYVNHMDVTDFKKNYKLNTDFLKQYQIDQKTFDNINTSNTIYTYDLITGWRLCDYIDYSIKQMFFCDKNGIGILTFSNYPSDTGGSFVPNTYKILVENKNIKDQTWYNNYLQSNYIVNADFSKGVPSSLITGSMFDISIINNSLLADFQKIPYQRNFALSIQNINHSIGIGFPILDLYNSYILPPNTPLGIKYDIYNSKFFNTGYRSSSPDAYSLNNCSTGYGNYGGFYNSSDLLNRNFLFPVNSPDINTTYQFTTPLLNGDFQEGTRVSLEIFDIQSGNTNGSQIMIQSFPTPPYSISCDSMPTSDVHFVFFENPLFNNISYYKFKDGEVATSLNIQEANKNGNNILPPYKYGEFSYLGYNINAGSFPSYSLGENSSIEKLYICNGQKDSTGKVPSFNDLYSSVNMYLDKVSDNQYITTNTDYTQCYTLIEFNYTISNNISSSYNNHGQQLNTVDGQSIGETSLSILFNGSNLVIDNIFLPLTVGSHTVKIKSKFYYGNTITFYTNLFPYMKNVSVTGVFTSLNKISPFFINGTQTATAIDGKGHIYVFYSNKGSGNIDVSVSNNYGEDWETYTSILRLLNTDEASQPFVICDKSTNVITLFFVLNNSFLMVKKIKTSNFNCLDLFKIYTPLTSFNANSPNNDGISQYSNEGQMLRMEENCFIQADSKDPYFQNEMTLMNQRIQNKLIPRNVFYGNLTGQEGSMLDQSFTGGTYSAYKDNKDQLRVFFSLPDGRLNVKISDNGLRWIYSIRYYNFHVNSFTDTANNNSYEISYLYTLYESYSDFVYVFYVYNNNLFFRKLKNSLLYTSNIQEFTNNGYQNTYVEGKDIDNYLTIQLNTDQNKKITYSTDCLPTYVVGNLPQTIANSIEKDIINKNNNNYIKESAINFYYQNPNSYLSNFDFNYNCTICGFVIKKGLIRIMYRNSNNFVFGATISENTPRLDCQLQPPVSN